MSKISYSITSWVKGFYDTRNPNKVLNPDGLSLDEYESQAEQCLHTAWHTLHLPDWKLEKKCTANGDIVESCHTEQFGKIYRFTGVVDCPAAMLYKIFLKDITRLPEWNPAVERLNIIKEIADGIDISYQVTAVAGLGLIAPRDFVTLRRVATLSHDGRVTVAEPHCYISSVVSVSVPDYPPHSSMVRGQNKVGCWVLWPKTVQIDEGKSEQKTVFQWLMCCDIKRRIPQFLLDVAVTTTMMDYVGYLRKFAVECSLMWPNECFRVTATGTNCLTCFKVKVKFLYCKCVQCARMGESHLAANALRMPLVEARSLRCSEAQRLRSMAGKPSVCASANMPDALQSIGLGSRSSVFTLGSRVFMSSSRGDAVASSLWMKQLDSHVHSRACSGNS